MTPTKSNTQPVNSATLFNKENYKWMLIGIVVIGFGMFLMRGGKSPNQADFNPKEVYSTVRITIAPILIVIGLAIEGFAIFSNKK